MKLLDRLSYTLHFTLYKIHVIIYLLEMPKFQATVSQGLNRDSLKLLRHSQFFGF